MARNKKKILPAVEPPRSCLDCQHCHLDGGHPGYSEMTPSSPMSWLCTKGWWEMERFDLDAGVVRNTIFVAPKCPDFEERPRMGA